MKSWIRNLLPRRDQDVEPMPGLEARDQCTASAPADLQKAANQLRNAGDAVAAERLYRQAVDADASFWPAWLGLGLIYLDSQKLIQAKQCFIEVDRIHPDSTDASYFLGLVAEAANDRPAAMGHFLRAIQIDASFKPALKSLAPHCLSDQQLDLFERLLRTALSLNPEDSDLRVLLGITLHQLRRQQEALVELDVVRVLRPNQLEVLINRAETLAALDRVEEARQACDELRTMAASDPSVRQALGWVYLALGLTAPALEEAEIARGLSPVSPDVHHLFGKIHWYLGNPVLAMSHWQKALHLDPHHVSARMAIADQLFFADDYRRAWPAYEARFASATVEIAPDGRVVQSLASLNRWDGSGASQGLLYLWAEQGFGDTLMMLPWVQTARERFTGEVFFYCPAPLARLAAQFIAPERLLPSRHSIPEGALNCPALSLPLALGLLQVPEPRPGYLQVPAAAREKFRSRADALPGFKVGLVWEGSKGYRENRQRNVPLAQFGALAKVPGVTFVNLQKDVAAETLAQFPGKMVDWMADVEDFADTAAVMQQLDLVISIDSAPAHLAGACGFPVWLLNRFLGEWRWGRTDSQENHWYRSLRVFHQSSPDDWTDVFEAMAVKLAELVSAAG